MIRRLRRRWDESTARERQAEKERQEAIEAWLVWMREEYGHLASSTNAFMGSNKPGVPARVGRGYRHWRYKR
jgi:hypothetical protein